jgi:phosphate transport system permease protein
MMIGKRQREKGAVWVWLSSLCLAAILTAVAVMLLVVMANGAGVFWPRRLALLTLADGTRALGEVMQWQTAADGKGRRVQLKIGNRDLYGLDFRWFDEVAIRELTYPAAAVCLERREYGNFYGFFAGASASAAVTDKTGNGLQERFQDAWHEVRAQAAELSALQSQTNDVNGARERLRLQLLRRRYHALPDASAASRDLLATDAELQARFTTLVEEQSRRMSELRAHSATFVDVGGREKAMPLIDIVALQQPNTMSLPAKLVFCLGKVWELLTGEPREANTEGGLFPAIVGTVMMVFIMSIFSFPLGVITAIYLREYAKDGIVVRLVRIAVSNLAGIPSIVYGIFGLGFFVYGVGGALDRLLYPERLPTPTFGTGGILWASLTLALLTVPVVIVATEEAFAAVPSGIREASLALGATQLQTLIRVLLPMASPGILTGFILAMARAAGEVAPLMITGVVKLAPTLPVDGGFPYLHLNRKFMHLGFHIYDVGFQSPNVEAAKPMVFVTTLLLVLIVLMLSSTAIILRNKMKKRYTITSF